MTDINTVLRDTTTTMCFVDFKNKRFCCTFPSTYDDRKWLVDNGFVAIDEAIAAPIILLNDNGCETQYCCSGHLGQMGSLYIVFTKISEEIDSKFRKTRLWGKTIDEHNRVTWRAKIPTLKDWRYALDELYNIVDGLDDNFEQYVKLIAKYKGNNIDRVFVKQSDIDSWCEKRLDTLLYAQID